MTGSAKQSILLRVSRWIASSFALRATADAVVARAPLRKRFAFVAGNHGAALLYPPTPLCDYPTGKSVRFIRSHVKPLAQKYFCLSEMQIRLYEWPSRPIQRGVAQRHQRGAGMRWTRMALLTRALEADGEIVWS